MHPVVVPADGHSGHAADIQYFHYERRTAYATEPLLIRRGRDGSRIGGPFGSVGWMTFSQPVVLIEPGADGAIFIRPDRILAESILQRRPNLSRPGVQDRNGLMPYSENEVVELDIEATITFRPGWHNYFHWMVQYLPFALHSTEVFPRSELLFPDYRSFDGKFVAPSFSEATYRQSVDTVVGGLAPIRILQPGFYRISTLHVPVFPQPSVFSHAYRDRYYERLASPLVDGDAARERLFISRRGATNQGRVDDFVHRRMAELARDLGFTSIRLEEFDWFEQIDLFSRAREVLAVHGAGLTNIIFSRDLTVYEYNQCIRNETHLRDPYFELSCDLGHDYRLIRDVDLEWITPSMFATTGCFNRSTSEGAGVRGLNEPGRRSRTRRR